MVVAPLVFKDNGYDAEQGLRAGLACQRLRVRAGVSATAVPVHELIAPAGLDARQPEKANFGVPATGSLPHFFALMMGEKAECARPGGGLPRLGPAADRT